MSLIERLDSIIAAVEGLARAARRDGDDDREDRAYDKVMALVDDLAQQHAGAVARIAELEAALDIAADDLRAEGHFEASARAYRPLDATGGQS